MDAVNGSPLPSHEPVKVFVGQVPRHMTEEDLLPMFNEAGSVHEIIIIKDKTTKASRGCCFVIYESKEYADNAIALFHNKRKLPPLSTPMQVKYAEGELEKLEHKLFVGMLPKSVTEDELTAVFFPFGVIKELTVIKGSQASRGCAFVKYETKDQAVAAIKALNETYKMEGSSTALVVKWADTEKEKQARKQQKPPVSTPVPPQQPAPTYGFVPGSYPLPAAVNGYGYQMQTQTPYGMAQYSSTPLMGQSGVQGSMLTAASAAGPVPAVGYDMNAANPVLTSSYGQSQPSGYGYPGFPAVQYPTTQQTSFATQANTPTLYQNAGLSTPSMGTSMGTVPLTKASVPTQVEGPPGANLFIYHLPADFGDYDLTTTFQPFGKVISSKVYIDKNTGLSKCFGFVSYDTPAAAQAAIATMNGAQLGGKRLKVQLKRDSRQNKPY